MDPSRYLLLTLLASSTLLPAQDWVLQSPANVPTVRNGAVLVYDLARRQTLMFGGAKDGSVNGGLNDTWTWDGTNWTQHNPTNVPPTRTLSGASYDLARGVVVVFGGRIHGGPVGANGALNDVWEWNGTDWTQVTTINPPAPRYSPAMAYDAARGVHVLYSGVTANNVSFDETWEYNGVSRTWTQRTTTRSPGGRVYSTMAFDQSRNRSVLYGGADDAFVLRPDVFWEFDGTDWTSVVPTTTPGGAQGHVMVYDLARSRVVIQGGQGVGRVIRVGTWEYDGVHTYAFQSEGTPAGGNWLASAAYDLARSRTLVFGGYNATLQRSADLWERDPAKPGFATFGTGCTGSAGSPELRARNLPALGGTFTIDVTNLNTSAQAFVLLGTNHRTWGAISLPLDLAILGMPGCTLYQSVEFATGVPNTAGSATWSVTIPNDPSLAGATFYNQGLATLAGTLATSNAGSARIW